MAQTDSETPAALDIVEPVGRRRVLFPWVWIGLIAGARGAFQFADVTVDFHNIATLASVVLLTAGLAVWYVIRGRGALWLRLGIGAAPFVAALVFNSLCELRFNGAGAVVGLHWRGGAEGDELLGQLPTDADAEGLLDWGPGEYDYPRFLGEGPWASSVGPPIDPDWANRTPEELWRREVGAGWASFAVYGPYAVTQEQRGDEELVVCYRLATGEPVWSHADPVRFDPEDFAGEMGRQGPRATPTIVAERVYTQGATGKINCLDARTGKPIWRVDSADRYGAAVPVWGKSGSPLFVAGGPGIDRDLVVVNIGAPASVASDYTSSLVAFDAATGDEVWAAGSRQTSYASPALLTLHGQRVVVQTSDDLLHAHRASDGVRLFEHPWFGRSNDRPTCSQPVSLPGDRILMAKGYGHGASLLQVSREGDAWSVEPLWDPPVKRVLQTKFSNTVVHGDHAYALNGEMLQCVEIATGNIAWRKRRRPKFGFGQVLLVGDHLLVMCEESGEIVLVEATPDAYREVAALAVLAEGEVCWNNPVVVGDLLLVRNAVEAAAFRLPLLENHHTQAEPVAVR